MFTDWAHALLMWNLQEAATLSKPPPTAFWVTLLVRSFVA